MRFFRNYANYALRAELSDFASARHSGSPDERCLNGDVYFFPISLIRLGLKGRRLDFQAAGFVFLLIT